MYSYKQKVLNFSLILNMLFYSHFASATIYVDWAPNLKEQNLGILYVSNKTLKVPISVPVQFAMTKDSDMTSIDYSVACYASFNDAKRAGENGGYPTKTVAMNLATSTAYTEDPKVKHMNNLKNSVWLNGGHVSTNLTFNNGFEGGNQSYSTYCIPIFPFSSAYAERTAIQSKGITKVIMGINTQAVPYISFLVNNLDLGSCVAGDKSESNTLRGVVGVSGTEFGSLGSLQQKVRVTQSTLPSDAYTEFKKTNTTSKGIDLLRQDYRFSGALGYNDLYINVPCPDSAGSKLYTLTITYTIN
ncbi:hypothetical protein [Providencia stuartii]|uniref:hypothetical protein n=1 Tax=Providencia stuartii TaxID=588 RepID=UPI0027E716DE|nr:hypothetical protein [Providencia stuartii]MDQ5992361.1 hypothetical protein [Providencia stuartii]